MVVLFRNHETTLFFVLWEADGAMIAVEEEEEKKEKEKEKEKEEGERRRNGKIYDRKRMRRRNGRIKSRNGRSWNWT